MRKTRVRKHAGLLALALIFSAVTFLPAAAKDLADEIPTQARGFAGTIEGKVVSRDDTGTTFILKVENVITVPKYSKWNKAKKPAALKGKKVLIYVRWFPVKGTKTYAPGEDHVRFVKGLKIDQGTTVDVFSDAQGRLILVEAPKEAGISK